jgi:hypothetical protein
MEQCGGLICHAHGSMSDGETKVCAWIGNFCKDTHGNYEITARSILIRLFGYSAFGSPFCDAEATYGNLMKNRAHSF